MNVFDSKSAETNRNISLAHSVLLRRYNRLSHEVSEEYAIKTVFGAVPSIINSVHKSKKEFMNELLWHGK